MQIWKIIVIFVFQNKSEFNYINLQDLARNFPLDFEYSAPDWNPYGNYPGFISKSYYQSSPESGYNYPPKGPIDPFFICSYCKKVGPEYHSIECKRPFDSSLLLTQEGTEKYPGRTRGTSYIMIVKKPGQKKVISSSLKSERFTDNVELVYQSKDLQKTVVRVSRNGVINIISANYSNIALSDLIVKKINESKCLTGDYPLPKYTIISSYKYIISAQYRITNTDSIDLAKLNTQLNSRRFKRVIDSEDVFMLDSADNMYPIAKYVYNSGDIESRNNRPTNPYILFTLIDHNVKINVMIYRKGAVQFKGSYLKAPDDSLDFNILKKVYAFVSDMISRITGIIVPEVKELKKVGIDNMIDSKEPQACHNRPGNEVRPVPFSFYGNCPQPGYYVAPRGVRRPDGKYEPCCYKKKLTGKDSSERYKKILMNGYPDAEAGKYLESIPNPDNLAAIYSPGTKIPESRRFKGLNDLSKDHLINCIQNSGYIESKNVFDDYTSLRDTVFAQFVFLTGSKENISQHPVSLTRSNFKLFTQKLFIVTPIFNGTIHVLLFFNDSGKSYFINTANDVSESGIPQIPELAGTLLDGYLYPFKGLEFIFYPVDILFFKKVNVMSKVYSDKTNGDRFTGLLYTISIINKTPGTLSIHPTFDEDIINGSKYYLKEYPISGLLFIPVDQEYQRNKINKNLLVWNSVSRKMDYYLSFSVTKVDKNRWKPKIDSKDIPELLLSHSIEIPIKFTDQFKIKDSDIILFKVLLNRISGKINIGKPLLALEKIDSQINDYSEVVSLLQSIQDPIPKETFTHSDGFLLDSEIYSTDSITTPLTLSG